MAFFLFILVNASLFIRPGELVPAFLGWEIYFYIIVTCLAVAAPDVLRTLTAQPLDRQPITLCVFGLLVCIAIQPVMRGDMPEAWRTSFAFAKVIVYYLLLVSLVTTPARMRILMLSLIICSGVVAALTVLRYHDLLELNTIDVIKDSSTGSYGEQTTVDRLRGTGIFQDPNELCVMLAAMLPFCFYFVLADREAWTKAVSIGLILLYGYAIYLTKSRGGFIAFVGGLGVISYRYFGWKKTLALGACGLPVLLLLFGGRQTEFSVNTATGHQRIELWHDWLIVFRQNLLFGNGMSLRPEPGMGETYLSRANVQLVAHNSYVQGFGDLGFIGGCLFLGAFLLALWLLYRVGRHQGIGLDGELKRQQPFLLGALVAYCLGMLTLTINYIVPTFMMLGLAVAHAQMASRVLLPPPKPVRFDFVLAGRLAAAGVVFLVLTYLFTKVAA